MKKIFVFFAMVLLGLNLHAQDNGFGVRAGVNIASITNLNAKVGFHVGGLYRLQLSSKVPVFFEPGVMLQFKGGKMTDDGISETVNLFYVEVPAVFSYRFKIDDTWAIQPAFGPYFAYGVSGTVKYSAMGHSESEELFGADGGAKRGDMGIKIAVGALIKSTYYVGVGYDAGLVNMIKNYDSGPKAKNGSFYITAGYNF